MSFKKIAARGIIFGLLLAMLLTGASCTKGTKKGETQTQPPLDDSGYSLKIERTDYNCDFTVLYPTWGMYTNFFFAEDAGSDDMQTSIFRRKQLVEDYLGVNVIGYSSGGITTITPEVINNSLSGTDNYQLVLTHTYQGVATLVGEGYLADLYEMEALELEADYWNLNVIQELEVGGSAYLALSDYMLSDPNAIFFNKNLLAMYGELEDPYQLVRDGRWTLEMMMEMASAVSLSNGDDVWDKNDTYGFGAMGNWQFLSLIDSCEIELVRNDDGYKQLNMGGDNVKYQALYDYCSELCDAQWSYLYAYGDTENAMSIIDGHALLTLESLKNAYTYRESVLKFGFLPLPKYDENQENYWSFDWSGMMCVPAAIQNQTMVAETLECLSYFSGDTTVVSYYEKLLGDRLANEPQDYEMLQIIFNGIVSNGVINYISDYSSPLYSLVYTIPYSLLHAKLKNNTVKTLASSWAENKDAAQIIIDQFMNS